jgi:hypothetical protein
VQDQRVDRQGPLVVVGGGHHLGGDRAVGGKGLTPDSPVATQVVPSPNHDERTLPVDALILHYTAMRS